MAHLVRESISSLAKKSHYWSCAGAMERRRLEDRAPGYVLTSIASAQVAGPANPRSGERDIEPRVRDGSAPVLILEADGGKLLCVAGGEMWRMSRPAGVPDGMLAEVVADDVHQHHASYLQKQRFNDGFLVFVERLNRARIPGDVHNALLEQVPQLMGTYAAALLLVSVAPNGPGLEPLVDARLPADLGAIPMSEMHGAHVPILLRHSDTEAGQPFAGLAALFTRAQARQITCTGIGAYGLLLLVERRFGRELSGEEWFRLQAIGRHAETALERLQLRSEYLGSRPAEGHHRAEEPDVSDGVGALRSH